LFVIRKKTKNGESYITIGRFHVFRFYRATNNERRTTPLSGSKQPFRKNAFELLACAQFKLEKIR